VALKKFLMISVVAALLVACDDDSVSNSVTDSDEVSSSSVCKNCDGSSSSKVKSSSSKAKSSSFAESSSSLAKSSSSKEIATNSSSSRKDEGGKSSSSDGSSSSSAKSSLSAASSSSKDIEPGEKPSSSSLVNSSSSETSVSSSSFAKSSSSSVASSSSILVEYVDPSTVVKGTMTDERDGKTYKTVKIGTQTWMAENLNYAYTGASYDYHDYISDSISWCYHDSVEYCNKYGRLYTWAAAMDSAGSWTTNGKGCGYNKTCSPTYLVRGICPEGWHLPDMYEWDLLIKALGDTAAGEYPFEVAGKKLKSTSGWYDNGNGLDTYSFTALPAGFRDDTRANNYYGENRGADFWTSTEGGYYDAFYMSLSFFDKTLDRIQNFKNFGFSVRCLKD